MLDQFIQPGLSLYVIMVFAAVFMLSQGVIVPAFGDARKTERRIHRRLAQVASTMQRVQLRSLLRDKYLHRLSGPERFLESLPGMEGLARKIEQAGHTMLAYRLVFLSIALAALFAAVAWTLSRMPGTTAAFAAFGLWLPFMKINRDRARRIATIEAGLPDAVDIIKRALKAGHPFSDAVNMVGQEMEGPVGREFALTFADINYGNNQRNALLGLVERVPSMTVTAIVTAVLIQKETGGNLAEILDQLSRLIRARFRFYRKVRTLSAEGRLSAWILGMIPLVLFAIVWITTPSYLPTLLEEPLGRKLIMGAAVLMLIGTIWIRRIIRIEA
ncbi:MAG: type II secretion system F family protein [Gammaproteobacteria bacterium]|nr:type II secretion system F family protein [Gammaproteobacteria bacterium]NNF59873.1 secretion system protein [Gammaproteobacteria bacterium]NNM21486.1 secretion system protein [Gammaproteobacteria bacterium]